MEIPALVTRQRAKIDVDRRPDPIPRRELRCLLALQTPERITDVLEVEAHATLEQARS